jgi:hypothetical protein
MSERQRDGGTERKRRKEIFKERKRPTEAEKKKRDIWIEGRTEKDIFSFQHDIKF